MLAELVCPVMRILSFCPVEEEADYSLYPDVPNRKSQRDLSFVETYPFPTNDKPIPADEVSKLYHDVSLSYYNPDEEELNYDIEDTFNANPFGEINLVDEERAEHFVPYPFHRIGSETLTYQCAAYFSLVIQTDFDMSFGDPCLQDHSISIFDITDQF